MDRSLGSRGGTKERVPGARSGSPLGEQRGTGGYEGPFMGVALLEHEGRKFYPEFSACWDVALVARKVWCFSAEGRLRARVNPNSGLNLQIS